MQKKDPQSAEQEKSSAPPRRPGKQEFTIYGVNACMRLFENRPQDILRVFFDRKRSSQLKKVKDFCRENKLPYRQLDQDSLKKVASGVHHEGVVMVVRPLKLKSYLSLVKNGKFDEGIYLALDGVGNTHNVGAILRSCGYFGVKGLIMQTGGEQAKVTSSAARMAAGALESVPIYECTDLSSALRDLKKKNMFVVGADLGAKQSLYEATVSLPCVVVMGGEQEGLSDRVKKRCDALVRVPGVGAMQSLNVSVAAGVVLGELFRRKAGSPKVRGS